MNRAREAGVRLVFLPHAGGSVGFFRPLATALPDRMDVLAVQYPGRQERLAEPVLTSIAQLADGVAAATESWADGTPVALFGHSMGATVAFEVALRLERAGMRPRWLFVSARGAPSRRLAERTDQLDDNALVAELHRMEGTDPAVLESPDLLEIVLPAFRGDLTAVRTYPGSTSRVNCPVTVLAGAGDRTTALADARAWREHTTGPCDVVVLPGGHFYLAERVDDVAGVLAARLSPPLPVS